MTIVEAVKLVFAEIKEPLSAKQIYNSIIKRGLYNFNSDNPIGIVATQIRRHCVGIKLNYSEKMRNYFKQDDQGCYSLIDNSSIIYEEFSSTHSDFISLYEKSQNELKLKLLSGLINLSPHAFEVFSKHLLTAFGFKQMKVTKISRDGGIDGYGKLKVGLVFFNVAVQCKRWSHNKVPRKEIDAFRGAIQGKYEQGIFFTTSSFTKDAEVVSVVPGAVPIVLIDGPAITDFMLEKELGVQLEKQLPIYNYALDLLLGEEI